MAGESQVGGSRWLGTCTGSVTRFPSSMAVIPVVENDTRSHCVKVIEFQWTRVPMHALLGCTCRVNKST